MISSRTEPSRFAAVRGWRKELRALALGEKIRLRRERRKSIPGGFGADILSATIPPQPDLLLQCKHKESSCYRPRVLQHNRDGWAADVSGTANSRRDVR